MIRFGIFVLALVYSSSAHPPCLCGRNFLPVCATNGVTYPNQCMLDCAKSTNSEIELQNPGPCKTEETPQCICTFEYQPVCGTDGKTHSNPCEARCVKADVAYYGSCKSAIVPSCQCGRIKRPVCGSDGKTYMNDCLLNCATAQDSTLKISHEGPCLTVKVVDVFPPCTCTREKRPVCGSDGNTYSNDCLLNCATAQDSTLKISHEGPCLTVKVVDVFPPCTCSREKNPVCGSDGKTYSNDCLLNCATAFNSRLSVEHSGPCANGVIVVDHPSSQDTCSCTRNLEPVCGADGVTYGNECLLECAGTKKTRDAPCEAVHIVDN